jgi:hypothetical protein
MTPPSATKDAVVLKQMRLPHSEDDSLHMPNPESVFKIQNEAIIMERLTPFKQIVTSYGHCGLSIMAESAPIEACKEMMSGKGYIKQSELDAEGELRPRNNMTLAAKLDFAIDMAESLCVIHGFEGGVIAHGDIHPVQYLRTPDGTLKLNDFNNAEILNWNPQEQKYCKTDRGAWGGMVRCFCRFR